MECGPGGIVTIKAKIKNVGTTDGLYTAILNCNGRESQKKDILLPKGTMETVTFKERMELDRMKDRQDGIYICNISIGGISENVTIKAGLLPTYHIGDQWVFRYPQENIMSTENIVMIRENDYVVGVLFKGLKDFITENGSKWLDRMSLDAIEYQSPLYLSQWNICSYKVIKSYDYVEGSPWPLDIGKKFKRTEEEIKTFSIMGGGNWTERANKIRLFKVVGREKIKVPAGRFWCFKIEIYEGHYYLTQIKWYSEVAKTFVKIIDVDTDEEVRYLSQFQFQADK